MQLSGRLINVSSDGERASLVVMVADQLWALTAGLSHIAGVQVGDVVQLECADDHQLLGPCVRMAGPSSAFDAQGDALRWRQPGVAVSRMQRLLARQQMVSAIRQDLAAQGYLEVAVPVQLPSTCPDATIASFKTESGYLTTSTEYQLKRLMAGGFDAVFSVSQNFRRGDSGTHHNPEFTMLEWGRVAASLATIEDDAVRFIRQACSAIHSDQLVIMRNGRAIDLQADWPRLSVRQALHDYLGVTLDDSFSLASAIAGADEAGVVIPPELRADVQDVMSSLLDSLQPHLGWDAPLFLVDWPAFMTSSAALRPDNDQIALRSELFIAGIEVADGFPFLTDYALHRELFSRANQRRQELGIETVVYDERYLEMLRNGLPPGAGMALGLDRLAMVLTGAEQIRDVMTFSWDEL